LKRIVGFLTSVCALGLILSACSSSSTPGAPPNPTGPVGNPPATTQTSVYTLQTTAAVPGVPTGAVTGTAGGNASWVDISAFDIGGTGFYVVADKANAGVTEINAATNTYVATAGKGKFGGFGAAVTVNGNTNRTGGPNGIVPIGNGNIFVGDANSNLQVVNTATGTVVSPSAGCLPTNLVTKTTSLPGPTAAGPLAPAVGGLICGWYTGGFFRLDEGAYDPTDGIVMMGNDEEITNPFLTFFSSTACATTTATKAQCILGTLTLTNAFSSVAATAGGLEQPVWDTAQKVFLVSVPATTQNLGGEIDVISATAMSILKVFPAPANCAPAGLALNQASEVLLIGCGGPNLTFMSATTGAILGTVAVGGADEVWYNPTDNRFYAACSNNLLNGSANPVAAVMDGTKLTLITVIQTTASAHSIAADPVTNKLFVPVLLSTGAPNTYPGGVAIFTHN